MSTYCDFCDEAPCRIGSEHRVVADLKKRLAAVTAERDALKELLGRALESITAMCGERFHLVPVIRAALSPAQTKPEAPKLPTRNGQIQPCGYCGEVGHITGTCPDWKP